jgi:hypothetical protein
MQPPKTKNKNKKKGKRKEKKGGNQRVINRPSASTITAELAVKRDGIFSLLWPGSVVFIVQSPEATAV